MKAFYDANQLFFVNNSRYLRVSLEVMSAEATKEAIKELQMCVLNEIISFFWYFLMPFKYQPFTNIDEDSAALGHMTNNYCNLDQSK